MRILFSFILCAASLTVFGQQFQYMTPVNMSEINSDAEDLNPLLSPDRSTLYFVRAFHPDNYKGETAGMDIWISKRNLQNNWFTPTNNTAWNTRDNNSVIGVRQDNQVVYLLNTYDSKGTVSFSKQANGQWDDPQAIDIPGIGRNKFIGYYMTPTFDVLLISMNDGNTVGEEDLFVSLKDVAGSWSVPINLGPTVNTSGFEISPFLSTDGRRLYFSSNGHSGLGDADIYVTERLYADSWTVWTKPRNLGAPINSPKFDAYFSTYGDTICYFSSNREGKMADIFSSKIKPISVEEDVPTVVLKFVEPAEVQKIFGKQLTLYFDKGTSELSANQRNLLSKVTTGLMNNKDINCRLVALKSAGTEDLEIHKERLLKTLDEFRRLGVEGSRFTFSTEQAKSSEAGSPDAVRLMFYR